MQECEDHMCVEVIPLAKMPRRNYCRAAEARVDYDDIARRLGARPTRGTFKDGLAFPKRYRDIGLRLSTGRFATLTQTEMRQAVVEIGLELIDGEAFYAGDLEAVISAMGLDAEHVKRLDNGIRWL